MIQGPPGKNGCLQLVGARDGLWATFRLLISSLYAASASSESGR